MPFSPSITWQDGRDGATPITAGRLTSAYAEVAAYAETVGPGGGSGAPTIVNSGTLVTSMTLDMAGFQSVLWKVTLGASLSFLTIMNLDAGKSVVLFLRQDSIGGREITQWPVVKWDSGAAPVNSKNAFALDVYTFTSDGATAIGVVTGQAFN